MTYELTRGASSPGRYKEPGLGWMTNYLFLVCFIGLFVLIPLRKILIVDYKLTFPSGMVWQLRSLLMDFIPKEMRWLRSK